MIRAVGVTEYGGPDALQVLDLPATECGPGQLRVRVVAAAINPTDTFVRNGARSKTGTPAGIADVPGMDVAGVLTEIGPGVHTDLQIGDRVVAIVVPKDEHGAYREDVVLPQGSVVAAPAGHDDIAAATLPMNAMTARKTLDLLSLEPGQVLAVTGSAGAYGGYVIQLAKHEGLHVIADAAEADEELIRSLGADEIVRRGTDVAARIRERFPEGVDGLADGAVLDEHVLPAVKDGGAVATVRGYRGDGRRGLQVHPVWVFGIAEEREMLAGLSALAAEGTLTLRVADAVAPAEAGRAHARLEAGGVRGRLVIDFSR